MNPTAPALALENLTKTYPHGDFSLACPHFTLPCGASCGLLGENGAGKSTLLHLITGALRPTTGQVRLFGQPAGTAVRQQLGYVPDGPCFAETLTPGGIERVLRPLFPQWDSPLYRELVRRFSLPEQPLKAFSRGMQARLNLAAALAHHPRLLLLDEATAGLDPLAREEIWGLLREFLLEESHSLLVSSHQTEELEGLCDYIVLLHRGRILLAGETDALLDGFVMLSCPAERLAELDSHALHSPRITAYGAEVLAERDKLPPGFDGPRPSLKQLMMGLCREADEV